MSYLQVIIGFVFLLGGAEFLVRGAVQISVKAGLSALLIGMTVVALGTSAPEFVVSLSAALDGSPGMALGNVVGSNIANLWLILGATAFLAPIVVDTRAVIRDALMVTAATALFTWLCLSGSIERIAGGVMVVALALYFLRSYLREKSDGAASAHLHEREAEEFQDVKMSTLMAWVSLIGGAVALSFGADQLVTGGSVIARGFGVPEEVIGLTLIAFGTSLPELAASGMAAWRGHTDVAIGNVIGSNLFNTLAVIGGVAMITPLEVPEQLVRFDVWVMMAATLMILAYLAVGRRFARPEGFLFLTAYGLYIAAQAVGVDQVLGWIS
ncbi:calcium/sodium antiporter [Magnetovibrio sp. PR-2]|uniref:calcium/sodium antiporter n=1 Tax=Magnetovibrio sp. PR-2 TaxID=3120356 RepID=UPI002FCE0EAA